MALRVTRHGWARFVAANIRMRWKLDALLEARDVLKARTRMNKTDREYLRIIVAELVRRGVPGGVRRY